MIAGFETPTSGDILLNGQSLVHIPIEKRKIGVVFQNYALFPHMTVADNIAYGLKFTNIERSEVRERVAEYLKLMSLEALGSRYPHELSGGQQQRVALARALAPEPNVLLLDEPLSNLDVKLRDEMREELMRIKKFSQITMVYVTHDQGEALYLADKIAVIKQGSVMQLGSPQSIYYDPNSSFVASFVGETNILTAERLQKLGISAALASPLYSLRPEKISFSGASDFTLKGTIKHYRFFGVLSTVLIKIDEGPLLTAYYYNGNTPQSFEEGALINLYLNKKDLVPISGEEK